MLAADRFHTTPWELVQQPIFWQDHAFIAMSAESEVKTVWAKERGS